MEKKQHHEVMQYLLYLFSQQKKIMNTYLRKELEKKFNLSRYQVYRLIKKLNETGAIRLNVISKKIYEIELVDARKIIDLIMCERTRNPETCNTTEDNEPTRKELLRHARQLLKTRWKRQNSNHKKATEQFMLKSTLTEEEQEEVTALFELWLMDIEDKVLWFRKPDGTDDFRQYTTRFNSKTKALEILKKAENCFENAKRMHSNGVFLTITLPPIFPQRLSLWILTFLVHRIKALIRKQYKESKPHIRVNEPQRTWNAHTHIIIFGIDFLLSKHELTKYLDKHLTEFLENLGRHYKKTINKNATEMDILALNELGSIYAKKYNKYKRQHPKFEGIINWITRIRVEDNTLVFENPPPDHKTNSGQFKTMKDGGSRTVFDYIKYYIMSAVVEAKEIEEHGVSKIKNNALVWYWFHRMPFFFASPALRTNQDRKMPAGWEFIGAFRLSENNFIYELMQQSRVEVIYKHAIF